MKNVMIGGLTALFATGCILAHSASAQPLTPFADHHAGVVTLTGWGDNGQGGGYGGTPQNQGGGYGGGQQPNSGGGYGGGQPQNQGGPYNNSGNQGTYDNNSGNQGGDYNGGNNGQPQGDYQGQQQQGGNSGQPQQGGNSGQSQSGGSQPTGNAGDKTACLADCNKQCMNDFVPGSTKQKTCSGRCGRVCR